jgi:hypothetical protein
MVETTTGLNAKRQLKQLKAKAGGEQKGSNLPFCLFA